MDFTSLTRKAGYRFGNPELLRQALTHRSYGAPHNERLEFLGDSVLNCVIALELYHQFPQIPEGDLHRLRASLINEERLYDIAQQIDLGASLLLGQGALKDGVARRPSVLADTVEALVGAAFVDGGFDAGRQVVLQLLGSAIAAADPSEPGKDAKTLLQELLHARRLALPQYGVVSTTGEAHGQQTFRVQCSIPELSIRTEGEGSSRRRAEQAAARRAYKTFAVEPRPMDVSGFRTGYIAIVGRPNVGKSTLLNALVGQKLSITSRKPQTTRQRLTGILTRKDAQLLFVDTPGFQKRHDSALNRSMNRVVTQSLADVDVVVLVVEATGFSAQDRAVVELLPAGRPVLLVINKIDKLADRRALLPFMKERAAEFAYAEIVPVSATRGDTRELEALVRAISGYLPEQPAIYGADEITEASERFLAAELIREKIFRLLGDELPYACTVVIERFELDGNLRRIHAAIIVDKDSHKGMVIGAGGGRLKTIATKARLDMEKLFGSKVHLEVWVKVKSGWTESQHLLREFGFG